MMDVIQWPLPNISFSKDHQMELWWRWFDCGYFFSSLLQWKKKGAFIQKSFLTLNNSQISTFAPKSNLISNPTKDKPSAMIWQKNGQGMNAMNKFKKVILGYIGGFYRSLLAQQIEGGKQSITCRWNWTVSSSDSCNIWQIVWIKRHFFVAKQTSGKQSRNTGQSRSMAQFSTAHCTCALPGVLQNESTLGKHICVKSFYFFISSHFGTNHHHHTHPHHCQQSCIVVESEMGWVLVCGILRYHQYKISSTDKIHILFIQLSFT